MYRYENLSDVVEIVNCLKNCGQYWELVKKQKDYFNQFSLEKQFEHIFTKYGLI